jgi:phage FluMu gp28-like protein
MFFLKAKARLDKFFMPYQISYVLDNSHLIIVEKGRQIGLSYAASYKAVCLAATTLAKLDVWVMSQDKTQAMQFLLYCKRWARVLKYAAQDLGEVVLNPDKDITAHVLKFANGICMYCLSSNPDAIVGKTGHVILDEFVLHKDQRQLYKLAKPVIQWGGTMTIISTHRGAQTVFNEIITDIKERGNKMGWSLHTISIQRAVADGIVEKINAATGRNESREDWLLRQRAECLDEEQWLQEYCCLPADERSAFLTYEMIAGCEDDTAKKDYSFIQQSRNPFFIGFDVARTTDLSVIDVEEKVGDVFWERMRIELRGSTFTEQEFELYRLLELPQVKRCCIDSTGLGMHLAERAGQRFGYKVEAVRFTGPVKEELAFPLRAAHEDRTLRYAKDDMLRADLRGIKKETTLSGNIRFAGEAKDSHCDQFWAKALAIHAAKTPRGIGACVG